VKKSGGKITIETQNRGKNAIAPSYIYIRFVHFVFHSAKFELLFSCAKWFCLKICIPIWRLYESKFFHLQLRLSCSKFSLTWIKRLSSSNLYNWRFLSSKLCINVSFILKTCQYKSLVLTFDALLEIVFLRL